MISTPTSTATVSAESRYALLRSTAASTPDIVPSTFFCLIPEQVYQRLEEIDAYTAEARASAILAGLSFDTAAQGRATKTFSGGWRMRIALAR